MTRKTPIAASVRARLLTVSKERREDYTLTLMNYAAERILYRLSRSTLREQFILKGAPWVGTCRSRSRMRLCEPPTTDAHVRKPAWRDDPALLVLLASL